MTDRFSLQGVCSIEHLQSEVEHLRGEVAALRTDIKFLVDTWNAARSFMTFIKWIATVSAAIAAAWVAIKSGTGH